MANTKNRLEYFFLYLSQQGGYFTLQSDGSITFPDEEHGDIVHQMIPIKGENSFIFRTEGYNDRTYTLKQIDEQDVPEVLADVCCEFISFTEEQKNDENDEIYVANILSNLSDNQIKILRESLELISHRETQ
jgi:hypothetical protein